MLRLILAGFLIFFPFRAHSADITALGGINYSAPTDLRSGSDQRWTGDAAPLFGLSLDLPFSELPFSFETGFFLKESRSEKTNPSLTSTSGSWTDIPLLVHYHFDPFMSLGLGGFWSFFRKGDTIAQSESPDSGLLMDLRAHIHLSEVISLILDARYAHGLSNLSAVAGDTYNTRSVQFLMGASYTLF
jgi:hypothetical protein